MFQLNRIKMIGEKMEEDIRFKGQKVKHITFSAYFSGATESFDCIVVLYQPIEKELYDPNYRSPSIPGVWRVRDFFEWDKSNKQRFHLTSLYSDLFFDKLVKQSLPYLNKKQKTNEKLA